ncbi:carbonic anhydrase [Flavobacterium agricola]|uniref:Carbonic anhydrase n=1 Tax=Flavobacterium agricola TaxID=2870839 RepID=A0ABY6LYJ2_9FLAO|nr:carbonic anhydrase family protein [Flavobacterium agricola]UYW00612.1 carbonic anhydrase [Flavobacterium agricola]
MKKYLSIFLLALLVSSCKVALVDKKDIIPNHVLSKEEQERLTPDEVILDLKQGNEAFASEKLTIRNTTQRMREAALGQYPEAVVLSCIDSRVPVEDVFNKAIGDIFVARVAGNIVDEDILGSLEYSCKVSGSKVVVVLGHEYCGAIKSSIDGVKLGHITAVLEKIDPAIDEAKKDFDGPTTSKNPEFVDQVCYFNVLNSMKVIRENSPILKEMEDLGQIKIVGAIYDLETGKVTFLDEQKI